MMPKILSPHKIWVNSPGSVLPLSPKFRLAHRPKSLATKLFILPENRTSTSAPAMVERQALYLLISWSVSMKKVQGLDDSEGSPCIPDNITLSSEQFRTEGSPPALIVARGNGYLKLRYIPCLPINCSPIDTICLGPSLAGVGSQKCPFRWTVELIWPISGTNQHVCALGTCWS